MAAISFKIAAPPTPSHLAETDHAGWRSRKCWCNRCGAPSRSGRDFSGRRVLRSNHRTGIFDNVTRDRFTRYIVSELPNGAFVLEDSTKTWTLSNGGSPVTVGGDVLSAESVGLAVSSGSMLKTISKQSMTSSTSGMSIPAVSAASTAPSTSAEAIGKKKSAASGGNVEAKHGMALVMSLFAVEIML